LRQGGSGTRPYLHQHHSPFAIRRSFHSPFAVFSHSPLATRYSLFAFFFHSRFAIRCLLIRDSPFFAARCSLLAARRLFHSAFLPFAGAALWFGDGLRRRTAF
jgi:hypothetical protein